MDLIDKYIGESKIFPKTKPIPNKVNRTDNPYEDFFKAMSKDGSSVEQNVEYKIGEFATVSHKGKYIEVKKFNKDKTQYTPNRLYPNGKIVKGDTVGEFKLSK